MDQLIAPQIRHPKRRCDRACRKLPQLLLAILTVASPLTTNGQSALDALNGVQFSPATGEETPSPEAEAAMERSAQRIRDSMSGGIFCVLDVCVEAPPLPSGPASEFVEHSADEAYGEYLTTARKMEMCADETCVNQVVEQALGVTRAAPEVAP